MSHHKGGFEPETNGFQFYAIANLDKTSLPLNETTCVENSHFKLKRHFKFA